MENKIINYINQTPENTNPSVLATLLGELKVPKPLTYDYMPEGYPSKSGFSIDWDGNTEGLVAVEAGGETVYKVSDLTPTYDELIGSIVERSDGNKVEIASDYVVVISEDITTVGFLLVIKKDNATFAETTFPQKGTYFVKNSDGYTTKISKQVITPIAEEFLPPDIKSSSKVYKFYSESGTSAPQHISDDGTIGALVTWDEAKQAYEEWLNGEASIRILIYKRLAEGEDNTWANPIAVRQRAEDSSGSTFGIVFDTMYGGSLKQALVPYSS